MKLSSKLLRRKGIFFLNIKSCTVKSILPRLELGFPVEEKELIDLVQSEQQPFDLLYLYLCYHYGLNNININSGKAAVCKKQLNKFEDLELVKYPQEADAIYILQCFHHSPHLAWFNQDNWKLNYFKAVCSDSNREHHLKLSHKFKRIAACPANLPLGHSYAQWALSQDYLDEYKLYKRTKDLTMYKLLSRWAARPSDLENGNPHAQWILANVKWENNLAFQNIDWQLSRKLLLKATRLEDDDLENGSAAAQNFLKQAYLLGDPSLNFVKDYEKSRILLFAAARGYDIRDGDPRAQWHLCKAFQDGCEKLGIEKNFEQYTYFLNAAAYNKHPTAEKIWRDQKDDILGGLQVNHISRTK